CISLAERLEEPGQLLRSHSNPPIRHFEVYPVSLVHPCRPSRERDLALCRELRCVAEQVEQDLPYLGLVGTQLPELRPTFQRKSIAVLRYQRLDGGPYVIEQSDYVEGLDEHVHLACLDLR